ncbi:MULTISPECIES: hypothetical protein [unclassified Leptolyngbya]|uniref:hypothetical protein n=1 Tax=unclassified Leptolyngbya TaxID=2650499 RepID=UPI00168A0D94|nr:MULTISPECIES: hypothetical protein [unclassified Leptolyngbya]MBD1912645.1 hypothetical protein [Leptolyngbya sp. FACHB-8]MBD2156816.1 hypothetical protein [Leptolyngbya sp. FACHB-16]
MIQRYAIACITLVAVALPQVALAIPLQAGTYSNRNRIIDIRSQGDRLCFQSFSNNRLVTASISRDRSNNDFYKVNETEERLYQEELGRILAGPLHQLQPYALSNDYSGNVNPLMRECLDDNGRYYEEVQTVG